MEGDLIATIRETSTSSATSTQVGVPGRHEIDGTQEIHYPALMEALVDLNHRGYSHEFVPKSYPLTPLRQAEDICDV
jgi:hydroxypyruvate isomerase